MVKAKSEGKRWIDVVLFRHVYSDADFDITSRYLVVRGDSYKLSKIKQLQIRKLSVKDNLVRLASIVFALSAATWAFVPQFGFLALIASSFIALLSFKKYELRAEFRGCDETGDQWVSLVRCCTKNEYSTLKEIYSSVQPKL